MAQDVIFPPIVESYQPTFVQGSEESVGGGRIYFTFSDFTSPSEVNSNVLVSFVNPNTNKTLLDTEKFPYELVVLPYEYDSTRQKYYVAIPPEAVNIDLPYNMYFKAQLRFISRSVSGGDWLDKTWYTLYATQMSEWSSITLIRNIAQPTLELKFNGTSYSTSTVGCTISPSFAQITGILKWASTEEQDRLNYVSIVIYDSDRHIVESSGNIYTNHSNAFTYKLSHFLANNQTYTAAIRYTTLTGYSKSWDYILYVRASTPSGGSGAISVQADEDQGVIHVTVSLSSSASGSLRLRRSSYKDNFSTFEELVENPSFSGRLFYYDDYTAESGCFYQYSAEVGSSVYTSGNVLLNLEDLYLSNAKAHFKIRYNPSVSSFKIAVTETTTNTLGGQFPIVRRNGNMYYRQFSLGGLISFMADPDEKLYHDPAHFGDSVRDHIASYINKSSLFLSKQAAYNSAESLYREYNQNNNIDDYLDTIFEKVFREKAIEFLCDSSAKLFRSATEGNILVRLSNISFTPNTQMGNRVYSFSATATEVDECTIANYYKYGILRELDPSDEYAYVLKTVRASDEPDAKDWEKTGFNSYTDTVYVSTDKIYELLKENGSVPWSIILNEEKRKA